MFCRLAFGRASHPYDASRKLTCFSSDTGRILLDDPSCTNGTLHAVLDYYETNTLIKMHGKQFRSNCDDN